MKTVGLDRSYDDEHPFFLPKGLRQRISIASILALRPSVIIVDEPTTGQDFKQSYEIMESLQKLNALGHTIIINYTRTVRVKCGDGLTCFHWGAYIRKFTHLNGFLIFLRNIEADSFWLRRWVLVQNFRKSVRVFIELHGAVSIAI